MIGSNFRGSLAFMRLLAFPCLLVAPLIDAGSVQAQNTAPKPAKSAAPFAGFGSNSKDPIKIDANKLEVFDKENRAVYSGDVVTVQGPTILRCAAMSIFYRGGRQGSGEAPTGSPQAAIRQIDCSGKVSVLSSQQSITAEKMVYDADKDTVTFLTRVVISDCENVQRGERVVYDVKTGRATVDAGPTGRVQGVFTPGGDDKKQKSTEKDCPSSPTSPTPRR